MTKRTFHSDIPAGIARLLTGLVMGRAPCVVPWGPSLTVSEAGEAAHEVSG